MDFAIFTNAPEAETTDCVVIPIWENTKKANNLLKSLDQASAGYFSKVISNGDINGKLGQSLILYQVPKMPSNTRYMLLGCGSETINPDQFILAIKHMVTTLKTSSVASISCFITDIAVGERDLAWKLRQATIAAIDAAYNFEAFKSTPKKIAIKQINFYLPKNFYVENKKIFEKEIKLGKNIGESASFARNMTNTPGNICNPNYMANQALQLSKKYPKISCTVLNRKEMEKLGMRAILAVGQGSINPPKLVILKYNFKTGNKPIIFVGKGITFDTGGNSLKTPAAMIGMKYDMTGAATVLALMRFVAAAKLPLSVIGIMACAENMPGGTAIRPDDIITSMAGITIEIANTDAEGRLVLCDALNYSAKFKPKTVIDIATLTGACVVALGKHYSGLFSNNKKLAEELLHAGNISGDKCWELPLGEEFQSQLDSQCADIVNVGGPDAGSITAACFLSRFTKNLNWAHLDIAGTATNKEKVATGRPVSLLSQFLLNQLEEITE